MRTKLFLAFFVVILVALVSNLIYQNFIEQDFRDYVRGSKEDTLYWVLATVEGSYNDGVWSIDALHEAVHWGIMFGFDIRIENTAGEEIINSSHVLSELSASMNRRMAGIIDMGSATGAFEPYPLYREGREIGIMYVRDMRRTGSVAEKGDIFRQRGKTFLVISFIIAGGGAIFLSLLFTIFLSMPLKRMKAAVESMARGDFSVRLPAGSTDEIGRLAASFNFMAEALQREEALRKHLTSNITHELRTPLAVIKAQIEAMVDGIVDTNVHTLDTMRLEVEKLIRLVRGIEDVTKAEASFFKKMSHEQIDIPQFLSVMVSKNSPFADDKKLNLRMVDRGPLTAVSDREKLDTIVQNILTNAIRNTDSGGITLDYGAVDSMFFLEVSDTGKGIPDSRKDIIYRRFYRGEGSEGIGLGLAIVRELVDVMGGKIDLSSEEGKGATFRVFLPLVRSA